MLTPFLCAWNGVENDGVNESSNCSLSCMIEEEVEDMHFELEDVLDGDESTLKDASNGYHVKLKGILPTLLL